MWIAHVLTAPAVDLIYRFRHIQFLFNVKYFRKIINGLGKNTLDLMPPPTMYCEIAMGGSKVRLASGWRSAKPPTR